MIHLFKFHQCNKSCNSNISPQTDWKRFARRRCFIIFRSTRTFVIVYQPNFPYHIVNEDRQMKSHFGILEDHYDHFWPSQSDVLPFSPLLSPLKIKIKNKICKIGLNLRQILYFEMGLTWGQNSAGCWGAKIQKKILIEPIESKVV